MAKKILILLVALFVCVASYNVFALDLTDDEEFEEIVTDATFLLDSPLFTQEEDYEENTKEYSVEEPYEMVLENDKFALYHNADRGYSIRILNKANGYVWSSNGTGTLSNNVFIANVLGEDGKPVNFAAGGILATDQDYVNITPEIDAKNMNVTYKVVLPEDLISFEYTISLTEDGFKVNMDNESIVESGTHKFYDITFLPSFGAVAVDEDEETGEKSLSIPGYIVIPSGNGGLIRYTVNPTINTLYTASFYGTDLNYHTDNTKVGNTLSMPVYGLVHGVNQQACLVEIKDGDSIASFNYESAGVNGSKYHKTYLTFNYRRNYTITTTSTFQLTSEMSECDIDVEYSLLHGEKDANYVGIAQKYQESLVKSGTLGKAKDQLASSTQMHVEAFGREFEEGLIRRKYVNMTTIDDLIDINNELQLNGINDVMYTLKGYYKGGYSGANPTNLNYEKALGNLNKLDKNDINYYLYYNPVETRGSRLQYPGYNLVNVSRNEYYLEEEKDAKYTFFTDVKTIQDGLNKAISKYDDLVAYDGITQYLYGDFNNEYTRQDTLDLYTSIFGDDLYPMYSPNSYLLKNTSKYLNMSLYHEKLKFVTDSVPFTQIVLRGYMDLYSSYLNFSSNQDIDALKCIEYGVYPAYLISKEASHKLSDTLSNNLYATEYERVRNKMISQYEMIKTALDQVVGAEIVSREVLAAGVVEVTYNNGVSIVVNYTNDAVPYKGVTVKRMGFEVINNG